MIGFTTTGATPFSLMSIVSATFGARSTTRPFTSGPRSSILTVALLPLSKFVTVATLPRGNVLLAAISAFGFIRRPSAIFRLAKLLA